jgi:hypothetical protein
VFRKPDGRRKWVKSLHRVISTHDVRALVSVKDRLYCGGVDTYLTLSNYHGRTVARSVFAGGSSLLRIRDPESIAFFYPGILKEKNPIRDKSLISVIFSRAW